MILGLNMPPMNPDLDADPVVSFAIIVVKQLYGGLGQNWMNPALAARCFMLISFRTGYDPVLRSCEQMRSQVQLLCRDQSRRYI